MLDSGKIPSLLFWGPPGTGKTTLANLIARKLNRPLITLSAVQAGIKDVRAAIEVAEKAQSGVILFIDEIHRFNKAQQDSLLHAVESGLLTLIGATTENPSFEVISALLSRTQVYVLRALSEDDLRTIIHRAVQQDSELQNYTIDSAAAELGALYHLSGGDARKALGLLELIVSQFEVGATIAITNELVMRTAQQKIALFDKTGEQHYDIISAFIKSIRGSDPNAALYWLARMLEGGEDIRFIARRLIILASEDIGNANPNGLVLAVSCFQAIDVVGMPEARIILAQCVTYLAASPKSNASYVGINEALEAVRKQPNTSVPLHLRNAPTQLMQDMGYGADYKYSHDYTGAEGNQEFMPAGLEGTTFFRPKAIAREREMQAYLHHLWHGKYQYGE
jgi:putative ATPase